MEWLRAGTGQPWAGVKEGAWGLRRPERECTRLKRRQGRPGAGVGSWASCPPGQGCGGSGQTEGSGQRQVGAEKSTPTARVCQARVDRTQAWFQALQVELWAPWKIPSCPPRAAVVVGAVSVGRRTRAWSWGGWTLSGVGEE